MRIGDIDGFGYHRAAGFKAANGGPANLDHSGVLSDGDYLPDIDASGHVANGSDDEFDFRTTEEIANTSVAAGVGVTSTAGTLGSKFTDISLARTYDARSAANQILVGGNPNVGLVRGPGGAFPMPPSDQLPNQPGFQFRFDLEKGVADPTAPIYFNLVFGDYDVVPAEVRVTFASGASRILSLTRQNNGGGNDGLIQAATAYLAFGNVFTDAGSSWSGYLDVDFLAPNEPYTAFDYVELSTTKLVPEPASLALLGVGTLGVLGLGLRRRAAGARA